MKRTKVVLTIWIVIYFYLVSFAQSTTEQGYRNDILGGHFLQKNISLGTDKDGELVATIVKYIPEPNTNKAILYIHGYNDYFFQAQAAEEFVKNGYRFYAIDLRRYGRSLRKYQYPFYIKNLHEYFSEIDSAFAIMKNEGCSSIALMGHSTGGLIASLYANSRKTLVPCKALILNSPFLDMNMPKSLENFGIPLVSGLGAIFPKAKIGVGMSTAYAESLLKNYHGEWVFDTLWKFPTAPKLTMAWVRAIHKGHKEIKKKLNIPYPVLLLSSDKSIYGDTWTPEHQKGDAVLDVNDIQSLGKTMGKNIHPVVIENGLHDLILSNLKARTETFDSIFFFLKTYVK